MRFDHFPGAVATRRILPAALALWALVASSVSRAAAPQVWNADARQQLIAAVAAVAGRPLEALPAELPTDRPADAVVHARDLLGAGLALAAADLEQQPALRTQADARLHALAQRAPADGSLSQRAAVLLAGLHDEVLTGVYQPNCPGLSATLLRGDYNCLTAATLYLLAAERAGLECQVYERPGHVWCLVRAGRQQWQVETLQRDGVRPVVGETPGRPLFPRQVLARLYYNAALHRLDARAFDEAIALSDRALQLDASYAPAWHNLATALNNWAVELANDGRTEPALELLQAATALLPAEPDLQHNLAALQGARRLSLPLRSPGAAPAPPPAD